MSRKRTKTYKPKRKRTKNYSHKKKPPIKPINRQHYHSFQPGNELWKLAKNPGRNTIYQSAEELWKKACEYFEYIINNPLKEAKVVNDHGTPDVIYVDKLQAMTKEGLCIVLGIGTSTYDDYRKRPEFSGICSEIDSVMRNQTITGAAAGLLNHAIIARYLGLSEKKEVTGADGEPLMPVSENNERAKQSRLALMASVSDDLIEDEGDEE